VFTRDPAAGFADRPPTTIKALRILSRPTEVQAGARGLQSLGLNFHPQRRDLRPRFTYRNLVREQRQLRFYALVTALTVGDEVVRKRCSAFRCGRALCDDPDQ